MPKIEDTKDTLNIHNLHFRNGHTSSRKQLGKFKFMVVEFLLKLSSKKKKKFLLKLGFGKWNCHKLIHRVPCKDSLCDFQMDLKFLYLNVPLQTVRQISVLTFNLITCFVQDLHVLSSKKGVHLVLHGASGLPRELVKVHPLILVVIMSRMCLIF